MLEGEPRPNEDKIIPVIRITGELCNALADLPDEIRTSPTGLKLQRIVLGLIETVLPEVKTK